MEDPYRNRKNEPYREWAESLEDLAETSEEVAWMARFFIVAMMAIAGIVAYVKFFA